MLRTIENLTFNYEIIGAGRPIVMLHGYSIDHRLMKGCMEPVFSRLDGWKRIYLDLPGMGGTTGENWIRSSDEMLKAVEMMIEELIPGEPFVLMGESYGGYLARGLVKLHAEKIQGLHLLCPCIIAEHSKRTVPPHVTMIEDKQLLAVLSAEEREEFASISVVQSEPIWNRYQEEIMTGLAVSDKPFIEYIQREAYPFSFSLDESPFDKPTLILTGRQDSSVGYQDAWDILHKYPRATFGVIDLAGHNLQLEQEAIFNVMTTEWLNRVQREL